MAVVPTYRYVCWASDHDEIELVFTAITFKPHDDDMTACICEDPRRPYHGCPAHRGRATGMRMAGKDWFGQPYTDGKWRK